MAILHTGGVFSYLPHHLDLALEDSVGHSTCMSVLACRRAIMGWLVGSWRWGKYDYLPHRCGDSAVPVAAPRQDRLGCTIDPNDSSATHQHTHACTVTNRVFRRDIQVVG